MSAHHDGSGQISIYSGTGTPKVRQRAHIVFDVEGLRAIHTYAGQILEGLKP